jgi:photosystem II stability/assembly factor-like uncharacterized protein
VSHLIGAAGIEWEPFLPALTKEATMQRRTQGILLLVNCLASAAILTLAGCQGGGTSPDDDGGGGWNAKPSGTTKILASVYFVNSSTGWAVGSQGKILKTATGGK